MKISNSRRVCYLDNSSTSFPKPLSVISAINRHISDYAVSAGRVDSPLSKTVSEEISCLRKELMDFMNLGEGQVFFTQNATHACNTVIKGALGDGDHAIICSYSHNAIVRPIHKLQDEGNITYDVLNVSSLDLALNQLERFATARTKLLCINHVSNVTGQMAPIVELCRAAQEMGIKVLIDVTQSIGHVPRIFDTISPEFIVGTGHKSLLGPTGIGFFFARDFSIDSLTEGGTGYNSASPFQPQTVPDKFEAGTGNHLGISGLLAGIRYLSAKDHSAPFELAKNCHLALSKIEEVFLPVPLEIEKGAPIISFGIHDASSQEVADILASKFNIIVRGGLHCAPLMHKFLGTYPTGLVRASFGIFNTHKDVESLIDAIKEIIADDLLTKVATNYKQLPFPISGKDQIVNQ